MWHLTDEDGLPSMEVYNVFQDYRGFMWFGTDNGVCRYDGHQFKTFYHPKQRGKSFSYFLEDKQNRLWCINFAGQIFYFENDSMKLFEPFEKVYKSGFPRYAFDSDGKLWIISSGNPLYHYDFSTNKLIANDAHTYQFITNINADKKGNLLISADRLKFINKNKQVFSYSVDALIEYSRSEDEFYLIVSNHTPVSISKIADEKKFLPINTDVLKHNKARFTDFISFSANDRWFLTYDGVYHFEANESKSKLLGHILKGNAISWVAKDRENNYWVTTLKNGVFVIPSKNVWLMNKENSLLQSDRIARIAEDKEGLLYLGSALGNLVVFDPKLQKAVKSISIEKDKKDFDALSINKKSNMLYAHSNHTYIYNLEKGQIEKQFLNFSSVKDFSFDAYGNYLIATSYTAFFVLHSPEANVSPFCKHFTFEPQSSNPMGKKATFMVATLRKQRSVACLVNPSDTTLWVAYIDGLYYYKNGKEFVFKDEKNQHVYVTDFSLQEDGTVWVTTMQQGVIGIKNQHLITHLTTTSGLKSDYTRCIAVKDGKVWFATDKGIQVYTLLNKSLNDFVRENGLVTNDVLDIHIKDKIIYLATSKGLQWFNEGALSRNNIKPLVHIEEIRMNNKLIHLNETGSFDYANNNLDIQFTGIALRSRGAMTFAYRLTGLDTAWKMISGNERSVKFNALPPGKYRFEIKSINEDGYESEIASTNEFYIDAPYWLSWWFILLLALLLIIVVSAVFLLRINIMRRRSKLEYEKTKLELELRASQLSALKVQMNPHFIFNALNSIQEYILTNEKKLANSYLGKFSDLMRLYLDMSNKRSISLEEEIKAMKLYLELESMRFEENFSYQLTVSPELQMDEIMIPPMIIQPYVENAIKHGLLHRRTDKKLSISFNSGDENTLICEVYDNGIGRKQSLELNKIRHKKYASFATGATQKRLELLNAERNAQIGVRFDDLYHPDGNPIGTRVVITVPFN